MQPGNTLLWIATLSFIAYCPVLCWLDWKHHDIGSHAIWLPLIAINLPIVIAGYLLNLYPYPLSIISTIAVVLWLIIMQADILPGGDFMWLSLISLFMVRNPISGMPFMLMFSFYLVGMTAAAMFGVILDKRLRHQKISMAMLLEFPYMIPICCALIMAVVMG